MHCPSTAHAILSQQQLAPHNTTKSLELQYWCLRTCATPSMARSTSKVVVRLARCRCSCALVATAAATSCSKPWICGEGGTARIVSD